MMFPLVQLEPVRSGKDLTYLTGTLIILLLKQETEITSIFIHRIN